MMDPVLDTLVLPFEDGLISLPADGGPALFLRARYGDALEALPRDRIMCEQGFKPAHDTLAKRGFAMRDAIDARKFALTLILPPRQREEYRALLARAVSETQIGGIVMAAVSNLEGAKTAESDLKALAGGVDSLSKNKCRVFWAQVMPKRCDAELLTQWQALDTPRPVIDGRFLSRPGLFAWDRIDAGSQLLIQTLPRLSGIGADLGAGFGYLTAEALSVNPDITRIDAFEAEARALELARENLAGFGDRATCHWVDVTRGVPEGYDFIISNPPFHIDRADRHELGKSFITAAGRALKPGGAFFMVANRHLPYEETLKAAFKTVTVLADNGAFKVFKAIGPQPAKRQGKA